MHIKLGILSFVFLLVGCASSYNYMDITGVYEGNHLMLHKELTLRSDSTYMYLIEGDMYPEPIKQEGYWNLKKDNIILDAKYQCKIVKKYCVDTVKEGTICFYLSDTQGNSINNYVGGVNTGEMSYSFNSMGGNLYSVTFKKLPDNIFVSDFNQIYNDFELKLKNQAENTFYIKLFTKNEIQKDKWRFRYRNAKLIQDKKFEYDKKVLE